MLNLPNINLSVGRSCFVVCKGCYNHFGSSPIPVSNQIILRFLDYVRQSGISKVTLSGGDPLSRVDIIPLLEEIKKLGLFINLDTVGTAFLGATETVFFGRMPIKQVPAERLVELVDLLGIPLDGPNDEITRQFRSLRPDIFNEQLRILELLNKCNAKICLNTVVHKGNVESLGEMLPLVSEFSAIRKWQLFQFMPIGPLGYRNREQYVLDDSSFSDAATRLHAQLATSSFFGEVEFKSRGGRKGNYLLIDSDGNAWAPQTTSDPEWDAAHDASGQRHVFGNINQESDYPAIMKAASNHRLVFGRDSQLARVIM